MSGSGRKARHERNDWSELLFTATCIIYICVFTDGWPQLKVDRQTSGPG